MVSQLQFHEGDTTTSKTAITNLQALVRKLQADRQAHLDAIADIDESFGSLGIKPVRRRGRPRGAKKTTARKKSGKKKVAKKVRRRKKFKISAAASVLAFVKKSDKKGVTGGQIVKHWNAAGRGSGCYNALGKREQAKKLKRHAIKGKMRGSMYVVG